MRCTLALFACWGLVFGLYCLETRAAPANDNFADRLEISLPVYHFDGSTVGATSEPGEPLLSPTATQTLWWKFYAPEDCKFAVTIWSSWFYMDIEVYEGDSFGHMVRRSLAPDAAGTVYRLEGGKEYSLQLILFPENDFTMETRYYTVTNDMFASATLLEGTNVTFCGNYTGATLEPGEPALPCTNTVWARWTAPYTWRVTPSLAASFSYQYAAFYTGSTLDTLQGFPCLPGAGSCSFLALEGTVYSIQFAGMCDNFTFYLHQDPWLPCRNDNFADAQVIKGTGMNFPPTSFVGATMEPGEPAHMGAVPQKSIWWKWQAPVCGRLYFSGETTYVGDMVLALYTGDSVEALTLVGKATNGVLVQVTGGTTYHIAAAVRADAFGDATFFFQESNPSITSQIVPGNLLQEPSWEGTFLGPRDWRWTGDLSGYVNEKGGADGTTWPCLGGGTVLWQDVPTVPGHRYAIKFAYRIGGNLSACCGDGRVEVSFEGTPLGIAENPEAEGGFWHWAEFSSTATNSTSRVSFKNLGRNLEMDAFSVVDITAPPTIVTQPDSITTVNGGTAVFIVGAQGAPPLHYQWLFNGVALAGETTAFLVLHSVSTNQAGSYVAVITNLFGAVTSSAATLKVDAPTYPTIVWQPYGDTVPPGGYFSFNVAAIGTLPLSYQWFFNGNLLGMATNKCLVITNAAAADAGAYVVRVQNPAGTVFSLPATLRLGEAIPGGGLLNVANKALCDNATLEAPIFDVDGVTPLSGAAYLAQPYAGPSVAFLRPVGQPVSFPYPGFFQRQNVTLANVPPTANAVVQIRVWEATKGSSYEEARAFGGKFGKSDLLSVCAGGGMPPLPPACLTGLRSFNLVTGMPDFTVGTVQFVERRPPNTAVWAVNGRPGFRYLVEKAVDGSVWQPFTVLTNATGTITFTDSVSDGLATSLYRARILD